MKIFLFLLFLAFVFWLGTLQADYNESVKKNRGQAKGNPYQAKAYRKYPNPLHWKERKEYLRRLYRGEDPG